MRSESKQRLLDQLEMQLEDAQAAATEDELAAERAASSSVVASFERSGRSASLFPRICRASASSSPRRRRAHAAVRTSCRSSAKTSPRRWRSFRGSGRSSRRCASASRVGRARRSRKPRRRSIRSRAGFAGPSLLAMVLFEKFGQHQPLNRQSERYAREGIDLSLSTLADHVGACAAALAPCMR